MISKHDFSFASYSGYSHIWGHFGLTGCWPESVEKVYISCVMLAILVVVLPFAYS